MKKILAILTIALLAAGCKKSASSKAPGAATLITPVKDQICTTGTVVSDTVSNVSFSWNSGQNAASYDINIKNLLTQTITKKTVSGTTISVALIRNTPYSWYVTSKANGTSATTNSDTWKFYNAGSGVVTYAPYPAQIVAPVLGQIIANSGGKVNLSWTGAVASGKLLGYSVYFGPSNNPPLYKSNITDNFLNDVAVSANTTYYWHIITIDSNYNVTDSGVFNFFVQQ